jgi:hypothetical protein
MTQSLDPCPRCSSSAWRPAASTRSGSMPLSSLRFTRPGSATTRAQRWDDRGRALGAATVTTVGDGIVPSGLLRSVHFSAVASAMDDEGRPVGVMDDGAGYAAQQHRAHSPEPSGTHHDRRSVVLIGDLDDRLPHRSRGLDGDRFGLQARVSRDTDPSWAATFPASSAAARSSLKKSTMLAVAPAHAKRSRPWVLRGIGWLILGVHASS